MIFAFIQRRFLGVAPDSVDVLQVDTVARLRGNLLPRQAAAALPMIAVLVSTTMHDSSRSHRPTISSLILAQESMGHVYGCLRLATFSHSHDEL